MTRQVEEIRSAVRREIDRWEIFSTLEEETLPSVAGRVEALRWVLGCIDVLERKSAEEA